MYVPFYFLNYGIFDIFSLIKNKKILKIITFFETFQIFSKFAGTGSHPELPFTPKSVAFSWIAIKK